MRRAIVAVAVAITTLVAGACSGPEPSPSPASWPPILDAATAVDAAIRQAGIPGPFDVGEVVSGTYEALDPESHNAPGDPAAAARWARLAHRPVWRIELAGSMERRTLLLDAETGEVLGWIASSP
jgi:hypothetical protein